MLISENPDTFNIPDPIMPPKILLLPKMEPMVVFDLETTGLRKYIHCIQPF